MDSNFREFKAKKKYILPLIDVVLALAIYVPISINVKKHTLVSKVILIAVVIFIMYVIVDDIYRYYISEVKKTPDIAINNEKIILYGGSNMRKAEIKFSDISKIHIPKWDEAIEIRLKNNGRANINFKGFSEEDIKSIKDIFIEIKNLIGDQEKVSQLKTKDYHVVNGKTYIK